MLIKLSKRQTIIIYKICNKIPDLQILLIGRNKVTNIKFEVHNIVFNVDVQL